MEEELKLVQEIFPDAEIEVTDEWFETIWFGDDYQLCKCNDEYIFDYKVNGFDVQLKTPLLNEVIKVIKKLKALESK